MKNVVLLLLIYLCSTALRAQNDAPVQALDEIEKAVHDFVMSQQPSPELVDVEVNSLDSRLRLRPCEHELDSKWSPGSRSVGRVTVQVACAGPTPWRVHIQASVTIEGFVWALKRAVQRGDVLDETLIARKSIILGRGNPGLLRGGEPILETDVWMGYTFTRRVGAGKVLTGRMLKRAHLVKTGETVVIRHFSSGLKLQTTGIALEGAGAHQRLQVRNSSSGKVVDAIVAARGVVDVIH